MNARADLIEKIAAVPDDWIPDIDGFVEFRRQQELRRQEEEMAGFMVSLRKKRTGIDNTLFASTKGYGRHAPRIKIAINRPDSLNETTDGASMALHDFSTVGAYIPRDILEQVKSFVELNRDALLDYWETRIDTDDFLERLKPVPSEQK
jgi:hypothetical protein